MHLFRFIWFVNQFFISVDFHRNKTIKWRPMRRNARVVSENLHKYLLLLGISEEKNLLPFEYVNEVSSMFYLIFLNGEAASNCLQIRSFLWANVNWSFRFAAAFDYIERVLFSLCRSIQWNQTDGSFCNWHGYKLHSRFFIRRCCSCCCLLLV